MFQQSILDSSRLHQIKQRNGLAITNVTSTSIYLSSKKLERKIREKVKDHFIHNMERECFIDRIIEKVNSTALCETVSEYIDTVTPEELIKASEKIKPFFIKMRKISESKTKDGKDEIDEDIDLDLDSEFL